MPKELRISAVVTVPDGILEQAEKIAAAKPAIAAFLAALSEACGAENVAADCDLVTPRVVATKAAEFVDDRLGPGEHAARRRQLAA